MGQDDALIKEYSKDQLKDLMIKYYVLKCASIGVLLLHANEIKNVQNNCKMAMNLWGYKEISDFSELSNEFQPLLPFDENLIYSSD